MISLRETCLFSVLVFFILSQTQKIESKTLISKNSVLHEIKGTPDNSEFDNEKCNIKKSTVTCTGANTQDITDYFNKLEKTVNTIKLNKCDVPELNSDFFKSLEAASVVTLQIIDSQLHTIGDKSFEGFSALKTLELSDNEVTTLAKKSFDGLTTVSKLVLPSFKMDKVPVEAFAAFKALTQLDLSNRNIKALSGTVELSELVELNLEKNELKTFNNHITSTKLTNLNLSQNKLTETLDLDDNYKTLADLDVSHNELTAFGEEFYNFNSLVNLDLRTNKFKTIDYESMLQNKKLKAVYLDDNDWVCNDLKAITNAFNERGVIYKETDTKVAGRETEVDGIACREPLAQNCKIDKTTLSCDKNANAKEIQTFLEGHDEQLNTVKTIQLTECDLETIPADLFNKPNLKNVRTMQISQSKTTSIEQTAFGTLKTLQRLDLSNNKFTEIKSEYFKGLENLQSLDLTENQIATADKPFTYLTSLNELKVDTNFYKLNLQAGLFQGLTAYENLDLGHMEIEKLENGYFIGLDSLTTLILSNNKFTKLDENTFEGLKNLINLNLDGNTLTKLHQQAFKGLTRVKTLVLPSFKMDKVPVEAFEVFSALDKLDLSNRNIMALSGTVELSELVKLNLENNELKTFNNHITSSKLTNLNLSQNKLTETLDLDDNYKTLTDLDVSHNELTAFGEEFYNFNSLVNLDLRTNKFEIIDYESMLQNKKLKAVYLDDNDWVCNDLKAITNAFNERGVIYKETDTKVAGRETEVDGIACREPLAQNCKIDKTTLSCDKNANAKEIQTFLEGHDEQLNTVKTIQLTECDLETIPADLFNKPNLKNVKKMQISKSKTTSIEQKAFGSPLTLQQLDLSNNKFTEIKSEYFKGLENLQSLDLTENQITIADKPFTGLGSLTTLILSKNKFTKLEDNTFEGLIKLKNLNLDGNTLTELHKNAFDGLTSVTTLVLPSFNMDKVPVEAFAAFSALTNLDFSNRNIKALSGTVELSELVKLNLENNELKTFNNHITSSKLTNLNLSQNKLTETLDLDDNYKTLTDLDVSHNELTAFGEEFYNFNSLVNLDLRTNKFEIIDYESMLQNKKLKAVYLDDNDWVCNDLKAITNAFNERGVIYKETDTKVAGRETEVDGIACREPLAQNCKIDKTTLSCDKNANAKEIQTFLEGHDEQLNTVKTIQLTECDLETIPADLFNKPNLKNVKKMQISKSKTTSIEQKAFGSPLTLQQLDLSNNKFTEIKSEYFKGLENLQSLDLTENQITIADKPFTGLGSLTTLILSKNKFTKLEDNTFEGLIKLKNLNLDGNTLTELHKNAFDGLTSVTTLVLPSFNMDKVPVEAFAAFSALTNLDFSNRNIKALSGTVELSKLVKLNLENNELKTFNNHITSTKLTNLNLSQNKLTKTLDLDNNYKTLTNLDVSHNELTTFGDKLYNFKSLVNMDLRTNKFETIKYKILVANNLKLTSVMLQGNVWHCNELSDMINLFEKKEIKYKEGSDKPTDKKDNIKDIYCKKEPDDEDGGAATIRVAVFSIILVGCNILYNIF